MERDLLKGPCHNSKPGPVKQGFKAISNMGAKIREYIRLYEKLIFWGIDTVDQTMNLC
jgi:hypothetical protein